MNSAEHDPSVERRGLLLSVVGALGMAALGIGFFFATDSAAVLLDGLFSLIGFAVSLIAIRVATLVRQPDDECFHFGYAAFEPMLNLIKGLLIAFVTVFAMISAIGIVLNGGREIQNWVPGTHLHNCPEAYPVVVQLCSWYPIWHPITKPDIWIRENVGKPEI